MADLQHVAGLADLKRALELLPQRVAKNALRGAVNAGATVIRKEAAMLAPVRTGRMKRAVYQKWIREQSGPTQATYYVAVRAGKQYRAITKRRRVKGQTVVVTSNQDAFYWKFVEFGTSKMSARPFLRPAFEVRKSEAVERIKSYLAERIVSEAEKLRG